MLQFKILQNNIAYINNIIACLTEKQNMMILPFSDILYRTLLQIKVKLYTIILFKNFYLYITIER